MCLKSAIIRSVALVFMVLSSTAAQPSIRQMIMAGTTHTPEIKAGTMSAQDVESPKKSVVLAIAYSLILPGLGDYYAKNGETGKYFIGADVTLWLSYAGIRTYGKWIKDDARTFAVEKADADFSGKGQQFEVDLGNFVNVDEYNQAKLRNRQFELLYDPASSFAWQWNSDQDRLRFKDLRIKGDEVVRNSQFVLGALVINRVIAAISAARSVSDYNRNVQSLGGWRVQAGTAGGSIAADRVVVTLSRDF